jgi:ATP-dependent protease HslVU (ClpYQ) ATPase subunit
MSGFERDLADLTETELWEAIYHQHREQARIEAEYQAAGKEIDALVSRRGELRQEERESEARQQACQEELRRRALAERLDPEGEPR